MKITKEFLKKQNACSIGYEWFLECGETEHEPVINKLIAENHTNWANWCIVRLMTHKQCIQYSIFAAETVLGNYEKHYPGDDRPRKAIESAKACLKNDTEKNLSAAYSAADSAAYSAESATCSATCSAAYSAALSAKSASYSAAYSAAYSATCSAAKSASYSADSAARSAKSAADSAARSAKSAAYSAAESAYSAVMSEIISFGLSLLNGLNF